MSTHSPPTSSTPTSSVPSSSEDQTLISVIIQSQDGQQVETKIRPETIIGSLLRNYCLRREFEYRVMKFLINGEFFDLRKTAAQIGLKSGDQIDCMMPQDGGGISADNASTL